MSVLNEAIPLTADGDRLLDSAAEMPTIEMRDLGKQFGQVCAVSAIDLEVHRGELVSFLGPSGSGKTTTLMMVAGHEQPDRGSIMIEGRNITHAPPHQRDIGMVFQNYALFPHLTVEQNIAFPLRMRNVGRAETAEKVGSFLELVQLGGLEKRYPKQLSGGQSQRVALARALVFGPSILLMDEPLSALDKRLREEMQVEIRRIQKALGITTLYVTHDQHEALVLSDRIAVFENGRIAQIGTPQDVYDRPRTRFVANFLGEMSFLAGQVAEVVSGDLCKVAIAPGLTVTGRLAVPGHHGKVTVGIRPEAIVIGGAQRSGMNSVSGVVEAVDHYGEGCRITVKIADGPRLTTKQPNTGLGRQTSTGDRITLSWSWDKSAVIGEEHTNG